MNTIREARAEYFRRSGFAEDGGYGDKWVKLKAGPFTFGFPNTEARVRSVRLHDIHHVLTEYDTSWTGEAEIGAWEIGSGCGRHYPAWVLNFGAMTIGCVIAPRRTFRAFVRGRYSRNLYRGEFTESLLEHRVSELRELLAIPREPPPATRKDLAAFAGWSTAAAIITLAPYAAVAAGAVLLILGYARRRIQLPPT